MKQRFRARELWLFAPFLLIIAGAVYWGRVEQVSKPGASEMFVSEVIVEAAPGKRQEQGMSHQVVVKISHPWPKPKWWGRSYSYRSIAGALHPATARYDSPVNDPLQVAASGEVFVANRGAQVEQLPAQVVDENSGFEFDGTDYVSTNFLDLRSLPQRWGEVTLVGLYRIAGEPQIELKRQIRRAGETMPFAPDKNPRAQLVRTTTKPFYVLNSGNMSYDSCNTNFVVRGLDLANNQALDFQIYDVELHDDNGKIYRDDGSGVIRATQFFPSEPDGLPLRSDEQSKGLSVSVNRLFAMTRELKVTGKISANENWPLQFEFKLPPRDAATAAGK